jgi:hypothetical protein
MGYYKQQKADQAARRREKAAAKKAGQRNDGKAEWRGFVSFPRTQEMKKGADQLTHDGGTVWSLLTALLDEGVKMTLKWDAGSESYLCMFYVENSERQDAGLAMSAFADQAWDAMVRATYIFAVWGQMSLINPQFTLPDASSSKRDFWA